MGRNRRGGRLGPQRSISQSSLCVQCKLGRQDRGSRGVVRISADLGFGLGSDCENFGTHERHFSGYLRRRNRWRCAGSQDTREDRPQEVLQGLIAPCTRWISPVVAVGRQLPTLPPHGSRRTELSQRAPARGYDASAHLVAQTHRLAATRPPERLLSLSQLSKLFWM